MNETGFASIENTDQLHGNNQTLGWKSIPHRTTTQAGQCVFKAAPSTHIPNNSSLKIRSRATSPGHFAILQGMLSHMLSSISSSLLPRHMTHELISQSTQQGCGRGNNEVKRSTADVRVTGILKERTREMMEQNWPRSMRKGLIYPLSSLLPLSQSPLPLI